MEADLLRFFGVDLLDLGTARLSWRRLGNLVRHLPRESSTSLAQHGPDVYWGLPEHLLAVIADALHGANWQRARNPRAPKPKPMPRPGVKEPRKLGQGSGLTLSQVVERQRRWAAGELPHRREHRPEHVRGG